MNRTLYALLVAIDDYPAPVPALAGCVNDIEEVAAFLRHRARAEGWKVRLKLLKNGEATRDNLIAGFRTHLQKAGKDDVALFYYSGHGSQEPTPPEWWHLEPDHLDETLVCHDSRLPGHYDLADKELSVLIAEVAANEPHLLAIFDSCHSGSATRAAFSTSRVRRVPTAPQTRPLDSFIVAPETAKELALAGAAQPRSEHSNWLQLPHGRHIVLSACRADEEAKEITANGRQRGAFSYYLLETLKGHGADLTYRDLFKRVNALVRANVARQAPLIETSQTDELNQPFLGGAMRAQPAYFTVSFDPNAGWLIDGGSLHGLTAGTDDEATLFAVFSFGATPEQLGNVRAAIGTARLTELQPTQSLIQLTLKNDQAPDEQLTYKALLTATPLPPLAVAFGGEEHGIGLLRAALQKAGPGATPSLLVRETGQPQMQVTARATGFQIKRAAEDRPLVLETSGLTEASAQKVIAQLEHIARWLRLAELKNPDSRLAAEAVKLELYRDASAESDGTLTDPAEAGGELRLTYQLNEQTGKWQQPQFKVRLVNQSQQRLYCALLFLTETYEISSSLLSGNGVWLDPGEEVWALDRRPIFAKVPKELWAQGAVEMRDLLKLVVSTHEFDATLLDQPELNATFTISRGAHQRGVAPTTLGRLMRRVQVRSFGAEPEEDEDLAAWTTGEVLCVTVRPQASVSVPAAGRSVPLNERVTLLGHPQLAGVQARLTSVPLASRTANHPPLPAWLRDDPQVARPFQLSASRSGEAGLSVLELDNIQADAARQVTPDNPLRLDVRAPLGQAEQVLPVAFDGEFYLPLGLARRKADGVELVLDRLPQPQVGQVIGKRSLTGSIRIFFQKVATDYLGIANPYPLLAAARPQPDGTITPLVDAEQVRALVAASQRIVLYIHGIIGDTQGMCASAFQRPAGVGQQVPLLCDRYDLVLTFDYENLRTPIGETARLLKERLAAVGLSAGHGKTLDIVAHSMGGLVARSFIESLGGQAVVRHLIMLGTPNGGSPWSKIEDWALTALAVGLNGLSTVAWPAKALGWLVKAVEWVDVTLDQMNPQSDFIKKLWDAPGDPGVRYTIIAGNTSLIPRALATDGAGAPSLLQRLRARLNPQAALHDATALAFFNAPNDIAVSVESIKHVPGERTPPPRAREAACDHISYFSTEAGLRALAEAITD